MIKTVIENQNKFIWLDVIEPSVSELEQIASQYHLHPTSVQDCLDPEHLPKFERIGEITFIVARAYDERSNSEADGIQELTRKINIFVGENILITIHRKDQDFLVALRSKWEKISCQPGVTSGTSEMVNSTLFKSHLICELMSHIIGTYEKPLDAALNQLESLETEIFRHGSSRIIEEGYYLKRKAFVFKRMLRMLLEIVPKLGVQNEHSAPFIQDTKELGDSLYFYADELVENVNNLLNLHLSMDSARTNEASHRTNEVVGVLTIFSVFFMPLNFITGIYGMNFEILPGIKSRLGFPMSLLAMAVSTLVIYVWFKRRGWLR